MVSVDMCRHEWPGSGCRECSEEGRMRLIALIVRLESLCINPGDGGPYEDGEVPEIDEARAIIRTNTHALLRGAAESFLDDFAGGPNA